MKDTLKQEFTRRISMANSTELVVILYDMVLAYSDDAEKERVWTQILANYVAANGLDYKYVKDYGWDPIELPAENIDSFYSSGL